MAHIPRIYVAAPLQPGPVTLDAEQSRRLTAIMRLRAGDPFTLFTGDRREWQAVVTATTRGGLHATVTELLRQGSPPPLAVEVWCALVRPARFDWMIEKCTEAGVDVIRPIASEHAARGDGSSAVRRERWERLAVEAAEQCGRLTVPVVQATTSFAAALAGTRGLLLLGDPAGTPWPEAARHLPEHGAVTLAVGPEGGFSGHEAAAARAAGAIPVRFGPNTLRTETAAVVAVALLRAHE